MNNIELICTNLSKSFSGKTIFKNLSLKLTNKNSITVTGNNGSGKSTFLKVLANVIRPSSGNVVINENNNLFPKEKWFLKTGLLSPYLNLYDELTGFENLVFFFRLKTFISDEKQITGKVNSLLTEVNLYNKRNETVKNYSSGMKQRLKLAFAILNEPEILFMDEPRSNLDKYGIDIMISIAERQKENGILIIATNDEEDKLICSDLINIEDYK
ncbi:MAG TPA: ABC transporter ATP-binding protein [Ignavibacteria bacterium]|nr:ABC transporter ATP-binding protein [Ignavibacteria bacterium]